MCLCLFTCFVCVSIASELSLLGFSVEFEEGIVKQFAVFLAPSVAEKVEWVADIAQVWVCVHACMHDLCTVQQILFIMLVFTSIVH